METQDKKTDGSHTSPLRGKELRSCFTLGIGFLFLFSSFLSLQNIQGSLNDENGLGVFSLSFLYAAAIFSAFYAPSVINMIGVKRSMMVAFIGHLIYVLSNFYPSFYTLIPSSIILGAVTGPLWTASGTYLTLCAFSYAERTGTSIYTALSKLNGIFFTVFEFSNIVGNLLSSSVLYQGHYNITLTNTSSFCGAQDCPREHSDIIADPEPYIVYILLGTFLALVVFGLTIVAIFLIPLKTDETSEREKITKSLLSLFIMIARTDIKLMLPLMMYQAVGMVVMFAEVTKSFISCPIGIQNLGYVMTAYGACSTLNAFAFSFLAKFVRRYILIAFAGLLHMSLMLWMYQWSPDKNDTVKIYLLAMLWGVADGVWKTQVNAILGDIFANDKKNAFAILECMKYTGSTITFIYSSLICMRFKLIIAMAILALGLVLYWLVEFRFARIQKEIKIDQEVKLEKDKKESKVVDDK